MAALGIALLAGCSSTSDSEAGDSEAGDAPGKYDQTWATPYSETTCADWDSTMNDHEQWVAAADMLTGARNKGDGGDGMPSDALIDEFQSGITTACVVPTMTLTDAGVGLYLTDRARFRP
jgi:hypothetical protein